MHGTCTEILVCVLFCYEFRRVNQHHRGAQLARRNLLLEVSFHTCFRAGPASNLVSAIYPFSSRATLSASLDTTDERL